MQGIDLRDDGLRPEDVTEGEAEGRGGRDDTTTTEPSRDQERQRDGERAEQRREQVEPVGKRADRQIREQMRDQDVERDSRDCGRRRARAR